MTSGEKKKNSRNVYFLGKVYIYIYVCTVHLPEEYAIY